MSRSKNARGWLPLREKDKTTLSLVCDTFVPSIKTLDDSQFFKSSTTSIGADRELARVIEQEFSPSERNQMINLLRLLENPFLNLVLSGKFARFSKMDRASKENYLLNFSYSSIALKRKGFQALKRLALFTYYGYVPKGEASNPSWAHIGYSARPPGFAPTPRKISPTIPEREGQEFECDVCVVGSGAGGSIIAEHLSRAGWNVVILEAGDYYTTENFTGQEYAMTRKLFEQSGRAATKDLSFSLLEGSALGGSTVVNWNTSIKPEKWLRDEWEKEGVSGLGTAEFDSFVEFVWEKLGVNKNESQLNPNNEVLFRGCRSLGYKMPEDYDIISRNAVGCEKRCSFCTFGCQFACKQSTSAVLLPDAFDLGCRFFFGSKVRHLIIRQGGAVGVSALFQGKINFHVRSKIVVIAAGSINTPAILLRSGLRRKVGSNLLLHPTTAVSGYFDEIINMWEGPPQTCKVTRGTNLDGNHHGFWLEAVPAHPSLFASAIPWTGGRPHKEFMSKIGHRCGTIVLVRESGSGRVTIDKKGNPVCEYRLNKMDEESMIKGMVESARILVEAGAKKLSTLHCDGLEVEVSSKSDLDKFESEVRKRGIIPNKISLFSAHIMGTARMGRDGVSFCDDNAESYEIPGLFIGDASVFPTSPGINPMITIMSMAKRNAQRIDSILRKSKV